MYLVKDRECPWLLRTDNVLRSVIDKLADVVPPVFLPLLRKTWRDDGCWESGFDSDLSATERTALLLL